MLELQQTDPDQLSKQAQQPKPVSRDARLPDCAADPPAPPDVSAEASAHNSAGESRDGDPFDVLHQAAAASPKATASLVARTLYWLAAVLASLSLVAWTIAYRQRSVPYSWLAAASSLLSAFTVLAAALVDVTPRLRELRDVQSHFLKHLSRCHTGELDAIQRLAKQFTLDRLQYTEARLNLTIAQGRRRMPLAMPIQSLATPAAVGVAYLVAPKLGLVPNAQAWPAWLFLMLLVLSCLAIHHHLGMDALERSALLLQRAIARKQTLTRSENQRTFS